MFRLLKFTIVFLLFSTSCLKKKFSTIQIIGHAASGLNNSKSPFANNTIAAVQFALAFDECAGVELDVQMSKDGVLYCYHDTKLETKTSGNGCISELNSSDLEKLEYEFPYRSKMLKISDLNELNWKGKSLYFDLRLSSECNNEPVDVAKMITGFKNTAILSNSKLKPVFILSNFSQISSFDTLGFDVFLECASFEEAFGVIENTAIDGFVLRNKLVNKAQVLLLKEKKEVMLYEVRAAKPTRLALKKNPTYLMTDDLETAINEKY